MNQISFRLRTQFVLLILIAVVPMFVLALVNAATQRRTASESAVADSMRLARLVADTEGVQIEAARQLLTALAQLPEVRTLNRGGCSVIFANLLGQYDHYANLGAADINGEVFCSGRLLTNPINIKDRSYFQRALSLGTLAVGEYQIGRLTGTATLNFGYPIRGGNGQIAGVVYAELDLSSLSASAADASLPDGATMLVIDRNGVILARYPTLPDYIGKSVPDEPLVATIMSTHSEGTAEVKGLDGVLRLYAFRPLHVSNESDAYVAIGVPTEIVFAAANQNLLWNLLIISVVALASIAAALFISNATIMRQVNVLLRATRQLALGDLSVRTGLRGSPNELYQLAESFDDMAASLQERAFAAARAQLALSDREKRFRALIEHSAEAIALIDADGVIHYESPSASRILAYSVDELVGRNALSLIHPDDSADLIRQFVALQQEANRVEELQFRYKHRSGEWRWIEASGHNLLHDPSVAAIVTNFRDITSRNSAEQELFLRIDLQRIVTEISASFVNATTDTIDAAINDAISRLGSFAGVDRAYVFLFSPDRKTTSNTHEWCADGIEPQIESLQNLPAEGIEWWVSKIRAQETIYIPRVADLPPEAQAVREILEPQGIQSLVVVPIGADCYGFMGFDSVREERRWADDTIVLLRIVGEITAGALKRRDAELAETEQRQLAEALTNTAAALNRTLLFGEVLSAVLANVGKVVPHDSANIMLIEEDMQTVRVVRRSSEVYGANHLADLQLKLANFPTLEQMLATGTPLIVSDVSQYEPWVELDTTRSVRSYAGAPIRVQGQIIGFININSNTSNTYTLVHGRRLHALVDQIGIALTNARLYERVSQRNEELAALYSLSAHLREAATVEAMLPSILDEATHLVRGDAGMVITLNSDNSRFIVAQTTPNFAPLLGKSFSVESGISGIVLNTRQPYRTADYNAEPNRLSADDTLNEIAPAIFVPLLSEVELLGVLMIARRRESPRGEFTTADLNSLTTIGEMSGNALRRARLFDDSRRRLAQVQALRQIDLTITNSLNLRFTLDMLLQQVVSQLHVDAAAVLLVNAYSKELLFAAGRGFYTEGINGSRVKLGEGIAGIAALERRIIKVEGEVMQEPQFRRASLLAGEGFQAYFAVPLVARGEVKGLLDIFHRAPLFPDEEWINFMETLAGQAALAIENATLFENLERSNVELALAYDSTLEGWSRALDLRDRETEGHTQRVTEMAVKLGRRVGLGDVQLTQLRRGALLHDIGKMGIPDAILLKPGALNEDEWAIMQKHPVFAFEMLSPIHFLRTALDIPYCHHEKWDGTGYPRNLKGEQIPLAARVFAILDVWDALRSDRPYRKAWSRKQALDHMRSLGGKHFDPDILAIFLQMVDSGELP